MENVSHTLAGFVLARGGLEKTTPLAATALVVGANLPDVDLAWSSFKSALVYFHYHRGWTHSLPGAAVLTVLLWAVLLGVDRWVPAQRSGSGARARPLPLLAAAAMGVGSHLLMDAANSYGVRPLLPWSDRWMYGDLWVIVDPWLWLFLGGAVYMTGEGGRRRDLVWSMGAAAAAIVVLGAPVVPAVRSLLESCAGRVVLAFFRFPFATIEDEPDGGRSVVVRDARYTRRGRGFAVFSARLAPNGAPMIDPGGCP